MTSKILLSILLVAVGAYAAPRATEGDLIGAVALYRHGASTPGSSFPKDEFFSKTYLPEGFDQLTKKGKQQTYKLGQWFRSRYDSLLSKGYDPQDIYVFSSDLDRTLMDAEVNVAGIYPPTAIELWDEDILWQPIPVHTMSLDQDQFLYLNRYCPKFNNLYNELLTTTFYQNINQQYADLYAFVSENTGWNVTGTYYFYKLQSILYEYSLYNKLYVPDWSKEIDPVIFKYLAGLDYASYTATDGLKRLGDGPFFDRLLTHFDNIINKVSGNPKLMLLTAHGATIGSILNGMGLFDLKPPEYSSAVLWELRRDLQGQNYMNIFYKRNESDTVEELTLPGCTPTCTYETFSKFLSPFRVDIDTWEQECNE